MNKSATSKELLLETAKEIAYREGISKLSIRRVAAESGIAIGTVYNYYPAKSDLILAVMEDFWRSVFHRGSFDTESSDFIYSFGQLFEMIRGNLAQFEHSFLLEIPSLGQSDTPKGKQMERMYLEHMKDGMLRILIRDEKVDETVWNQSFTRKQFLDFAFANLMISIQAGAESCSFLQQIFRRLLYRQ